MCNMVTLPIHKKRVRLLSVCHKRGHHILIRYVSYTQTLAIYQLLIYPHNRRYIFEYFQSCLTFFAVPPDKVAVERLVSQLLAAIYGSKTESTRPSPLLDYLRCSLRYRNMDQNWNHLHEII